MKAAIATGCNVAADKGCVNKQSPRCRLDKECTKAVADQIHKARALYNNLVAVMRVIVTEQQAFVLDKAGNDAKTLDMEISGLTEQFLAARANQDEIAMKQVAQERHQKRVELWKMLAGARKEHKQESQERFLSRIGKRTECDTYKARCDAVSDGLGWATANEILDNALDAFKKTFAKGQAPKFAVGSEKVQDSLTLQFTAAGGVPSGLVLSKNKGELSMEPPSSGKYGEFRFRLGAAKDDVWATGTWFCDRMVPQAASIGLARLVRRKIGKDFKYWLQVQVKMPETVAPHSTKKPLVAVHFGWAKDGDVRNIAGIAECAEPSMVEILKLPERVEAMLNQSSVAQSRRDVALNELIPKIKVWNPVGMPDEIESELQAIKKLRTEYVSQSRLHKLCWAIKYAGLNVPDWLELWRKRDKMDWQEASHVARRARNVRKNFYRETAARLAATYSAIVLEKPDLKAVAELVDEQTGEKTKMSKKARGGRVIAGVYELDLAIRQAFEKAGGAILVMSGENTASRCAVCGGKVASLQDMADSAACTDCGAALNKKQNGAANAYRIASEVIEEKVADYHLEARKVFSEKQDKQREKLQKMADSRKNRRAQSVVE